MSNIHLRDATNTPQTSLQQRLANSVSTDLCSYITSFGMAVPHCDLAIGLTISCKTAPNLSTLPPSRASREKYEQANGRTEWAERIMSCV